MTKEIEYCYSTDEEMYSHTSFGDLLDEINCNTDEPLGATYWRGEKVELAHKDCISIEHFLEQCDESAYEEIGEVYENCFTDVKDEAKDELRELILAWSQKHVNICYWKVINSKELKITAEDLE